MPKSDVINASARTEADNTRWRDARRLGLIAFAYAFTLKLALFLPDAKGVLAAVWPPGGVALAVLLLAPRRQWRAILAVIFATGIGANLLSGRPAFASVGFMVANVLETWGCALVLTRFSEGNRVTFARLREVLALGVCAIAVNSLTALLGAAVAFVSSGASFKAFYLAWWIADGLGILLVTPLVVVCVQAWRHVATWRWPRLLEAGALGLVWYACAWLGFLGFANCLPVVPQPYFLCVPLMWAALRFGVRGMVVLLTLLAVIAVSLTVADRGMFPLGGHNPVEHLQMVQLFLGVFSLAGLFLAAAVTESQQTEDALAKARDELRLVLDLVPDMICTASPDGRFISANPAFAQTLGYSEKRLLEASYFDLIHPDDLEATRAEVQRELAGQSTVQFENRYRHQDGSYRTLEWHTTPAVGGILYAVARDVTARKQAEEEQKKLQAQLAQAQKMESVGRLAGGVAHDFNNMLMVIMGNAELCRQTIEPGHPMYKRLDEITKGAQRSVMLTRQLLAFARKQLIAPKVMDLNSAISDMLKLLQRLIGEDIAIVWRPGRSIWPVKMDSSQVDQILTNLVVNARDAIHGVGSIVIETDNTILDQTFCTQHPGATPGNYVLMQFSDTGCGMDPETCAHIFEPFFTTKDVGKGTGLGLATVYGIVTQNNGFIDVDSNPGKGTRLTIYWPRALVPDDPQAAADTRVAVAGGSETVLLVEDEKLVRAVAHSFLAGLGYTILVADSPESALRLAAAYPGEIHLLLTDVIMPGMNGKDLAQRLLELRPSIKRLFISGFTADVLAQRGILDDKLAFLKKPFSREDLARKVRETLGA